MKKESKVSEKAVAFMEQITETKCFKGKGNVLMNFSVQFNHQFWVAGFTLVKGPNGNFVSMPQKSYEQNGEMKYAPSFWLDGDTYTKEDKQTIYQLLLDMAMADLKDL